MEAVSNSGCWIMGIHKLVISAGSAEIQAIGRYSEFALPGFWIPAIPAGMTNLQKFSFSETCPDKKCLN
jgi:hypothetical protein